MSKYEEHIEKVIKKGLITSSIYSDFKREISFNNLKYKGHLLRFDFSFKINGRLIICEVDGQQHFDEVKFFNNFKHMKENDRRKNQYCLNNDIPLYRIPYWEVNNITSIEDIFNPKFRVKSKYHNDNLIWEYKQFNKVPIEKNHLILD